MRTVTDTLPTEPIVTELTQHADLRGSHLKWAGLGPLEIPGFDVVEVFRTRNAADVIRGLHFQQNPDQAKVVLCLTGSAIVNAVCLDPASPRFGEIERWVVDADKPTRLFVPRKWGLGYRITADDTIMVYFADAPFDAAGDTGIDPFDAELSVDWGQDISRETAVLSDRDKQLMSFADYRAQVGLGEVTR
jgi:dTDP-4-dehydrorhamnose 3,5-epimerase-like enzyme